MREDEPRKRVSTVIKKGKEDSMGSFEDIEDFELPQRTTKQGSSGPSGGNASGGNDSFEVVNYDDLNNMKPQEAGQNEAQLDSAVDDNDAKMFKNSFAGSGQITPKKKVLEQQKILANQGSSVSARGLKLTSMKTSDLRITNS